MPPHAVMEGPAMTTETLSAVPAFLDGEGVHATQPRIALARPAPA